MPRRGYHLCIASITTTVMAACGSPTDPEAAFPEGTPRQFFIVGEPVIDEAPGPVLVFKVTTPDSTPHRGWWPTTILVETDRGYSGEIQLAPYVCLDRSDRSDDFPFNLDWLACNRMGLNNATVLTKEQIEEVEQTIDGAFNFERRFKTMPGAQYGFYTGIGRPAINEAIRRVGELDFIDGEIYHPHQEPICVILDIFPPPPCPPWLLFRRMSFTFSAIPGESLPVSQGGWVRTTYTQPDGTTRSTVFEF